MFRLALILFGGDALIRALGTILLLLGLAMLVGAKFPLGQFDHPGVLFGAAFLFNGLLRIGGGLLIRYANWRTSCFLGAGFLVMALLLFTS